MTEETAHRTHNGNGHSKAWLIGVLGIVGTISAPFLFKAGEMIWTAASIFTRMETRLESVETGLRDVKTEAVEIKLLLQQKHHMRKAPPVR
jgi:hypothetical protein